MGPMEKRVNAKADLNLRIGGCNNVEMRERGAFGTGQAGVR